MGHKEDKFLRSFRLLDAFLRLAFWLCAAACFIVATAFSCMTILFLIEPLFLTIPKDSPSVPGLVIAGLSGFFWYWLGSRAARCSAFFKADSKGHSVVRNR
jgi:hypothetical protein